MPVLAAFRFVLLFAFLCSVKKLAKQHPTGFEPNNIRRNRNYMRHIKLMAVKVIFLFESLTLNGLLDKLATICEKILKYSTVCAILYIVIL